MKNTHDRNGKRFLRLLTLAAIVPFFMLLACGEKGAPGDAKSKNSATAGAIASGSFVRVTSSLAVRSGPDAKAKKVNCYLKEDIHKGKGLSTNGWESDTAGGSTKNTSYAPVGAVLKVLSATPQPVQVGKWNNYWYKVEATQALIKVAGTSAAFNCLTQGKVDMWVFGEFVKKTSSTFPKAVTDREG